MAEKRSNVPSIEDLQKYTVNRAGSVEAIRQTLYDFQTYAAAGATQFNFFQVPVGQAGKTLADTNMDQAGSLPAPKTFLVQSIEVHLFPATADIATNAAGDLVAWKDAYDVLTGRGWLDFFIGSKSYLQEAPLLRFPPKTKIGGPAALASGEAAVSMRLALANAEGRPYMLEPPVALISTQNFKVSLNFPAAIAINADARIGVILDGIMYRASQ